MIHRNYNACRNQRGFRVRMAAVTKLRPIRRDGAPAEGGSMDMADT